MNQRFTLKIHTLTDDPLGPRTIERTNWNGVGLIFPRTGLQKLLSNLSRATGRPELTKPGIYFLLGNPIDLAFSAESLPELYIGESGNLSSRLYNHNANKDFWSYGIVFTGTNDFLTVTHTKFLEYYFIEKAKQSGRTTLKNKTGPNKPFMSEADEIDSINFAEHIINCLNALGYDFLNPPTPKKSLKKEESVFYYFAEKTFSAKGFRNDRRFVVLKDSSIHPAVFPSASPFVVSTRDRLLNEGLLVVKGTDVVFSDDYEFNSGSAAASFIAGSSRSGNLCWKTQDGKTLRDIIDQIEATAN